MLLRPTLLSLALLVASPALANDDMPPAVREALARALGVSGGRLEPGSWKSSLPRGCQISGAMVDRPVQKSGRVAVKVDGDRCSGWGWAQVQVYAPVMITTRAVAAGDPIASAVEIVEREVTSRSGGGDIARGALAARPLARGTVVLPMHVRVDTPRPGEPIKVLLVSAGLAIETQGRVVPCMRGRSCAVLSTGKHLEGQFENGQLVVEVP